MDLIPDPYRLAVEVAVWLFWFGVRLAAYVVAELSK